MRGPPPTPTKILKSRGSWRAEVRKGEPNPPPSEKPKAPTWVVKPGQQHFNAAADIMERMGVLSVADELGIGLFADSFAQYLAAREIADREGMVIQAATGTYQVHPAQNVRDRAWEQLYRLCLQFGFTPAARARLVVEPREPAKSKPDDKIKDLINIA